MQRSLVRSRLIQLGEYFALIKAEKSLLVGTDLMNIDVIESRISIGPNFFEVFRGIGTTDKR